MAQHAAVSTRWGSSREAAGRSRHQSASRDMDMLMSVSRAERSGNQAVGWLLKGPSCVSLCPVLGRSVRGSGPDRRGSLVEIREREIWCQWHAVVFVRVKGNGAIEMGPRWSKDSRRLGQGTLVKGGHPWMARKSKVGKCQHGPRSWSNPPPGPPRCVGWVVVGRGSSGNLEHRRHLGLELPGCRGVSVANGGEGNGAFST